MLRAQFDLSSVPAFNLRGTILAVFAPQRYTAVYSETQPDVETLRQKAHKSIETLREQLKLLKLLLYRSHLIPEDLAADQQNQQKNTERALKKLLTNLARTEPKDS